MRVRAAVKREGRARGWLVAMALAVLLLVGSGCTSRSTQEEQPVRRGKAAQHRPEWTNSFMYPEGR
jgi:hypothetical protein